MAKIRILIADDHAILRTGLRLLINAQPDMEVVGEAMDGAETLRQMAATAPDLATIDFSMPGISGIQLIEQLHRKHPRTRLLVVTMHDEPALLRAVLISGGSGYFVKTAADAELLTALRNIHRGRIFVNVKAEDKLDAEHALVGGPPALLSQRELEVLQWLAQGHTNREIAGKLFIGVKTIETYRARLMEKLGLRSRAELVRYAMATGILAPLNPSGTDQVI